MQNLPTAIWTLARTTVEVLLAPPEITARALAEANAAPQLRWGRTPRTAAASPGPRRDWTPAPNGGPLTAH
ncbi:hypothetical protein [Phaeacidiphilus oryzae]|jgi:hypothetical protein|uniref:hypothetical protein n=1 Tax=Phaeacidiphilus oryzae TaxID=348818 RepID=UPI0005612B3A|nr:hypothetical protein [Phaeacidiphilus oryzae]